MSPRWYLLTGSLLFAVALAPSGPVATPAAQTCASRSDCGRLIGGLQLQSTGWACTSGFLARSTASDDVYVVTAGHCVADSGLLALWTHHGRPVGRATLTGFRPSSHADVAALAVAGANVGRGIYGSAPDDLRLLAGRSRDAAQTVGSVVCRSGGVSGWRCGSVIRADVPTSIRGVQIQHSWWVDFPSMRGDSGSPVLDADGRIAGIIIATTESESLYSTVDGIEQELGVRPCLDDACD
jgi:hypothetical protein